MVNQFTHVKELKSKLRKVNRTVQYVKGFKLLFTGQHSGCGPLPADTSNFMISDNGIVAPPPTLDRILQHRVESADGMGDDADSSNGSSDGTAAAAVPSSPTDAHYSTEELSMAVATTCVCAMVIGFIGGFLMARKCGCGGLLMPNQEMDNPYHVPYLNQ